MSKRHTVFIDGEAGTTGLQIAARLAGREDLEVAQIDPARRKDADARRAALNACDIAILCLPDDAAREAVALVDNPSTRIIDASTAHRTAAGWVYGFPEYAPSQRDAIRAATRIANPGCYAIAALGRTRARAGISADRGAVLQGHARARAVAIVGPAGAAVAGPGARRVRGLLRR